MPLFSCGKQGVNNFSTNFEAISFCLFDFFMILLLDLQTSYPFRAWEYGSNHIKNFILGDFINGDLKFVNIFYYRENDEELFSTKSLKKASNGELIS